MATVTLQRAGDPLADASHQLSILQPRPNQNSFAIALSEHGRSPLRATGIEVLQLNLGKLCNMTCQHCHVDAGPDRREVMTRQTAEACLRALASADIPTLDLTGGAPEMNPSFRFLVEEGRRFGRHVIDRSNLTILLAPGYVDLPEFLAEHRVEIVASLPCYTENNVDAQRGSYAFQRSIDAMRRLNELGYGRSGTGLELTLVYNPLGPSLPPPQAQLAEDYRRELAERYGVVFNRLFTITNMPIGRFLHRLVKAGQYDQYMEKLIAAFNPAAADGVMCRTTVSVDWEGRLYDCDFNQMLQLAVQPDMPRTIWDFDSNRLAHRLLTTGQHCYGCTAGAGSSCRGVTAR